MANKVAIVGKPNVGKSSLFNRLVGRREAIVADQPGVTRDVKKAKVVNDLEQEFILLDTGGLWSGDYWEEKIKKRTEDSLHDVNLILFTVEGRNDLDKADYEIAEWLRTLGKEVLLVATKVDDPIHEERPEMYELYALGFGEPFYTSSSHKRGILELNDLIIEMLPEDEGEPEELAVRVAIIGRPNVGKSSILNALVGSEEVIVADLAGTTRDSIDVEFNFAGRPFILVDTAGIRRKPSEDVEYYSKLRSEEAILKADVAVLVIDPFELGDHEMRMANVALEAGKPVVLAINKWDLVTDAQLEPFRRNIAQELYHLRNYPKVYTSAETDFGLHELLATAIRLYDTSRKRISTGELNQWIQVWTQRQAPPNFQGRPLKIYYLTQADIQPPTFVFSINNDRFVTRPYEQYLLNRVSEDLGFTEVPTRFIFKARGKAEGRKRIRL